MGVVSGEARTGGRVRMNGWNRVGVSGLGEERRAVVGGPCWIKGRWFVEVVVN